MLPSKIGFAGCSIALIFTLTGCSDSNPSDTTVGSNTPANNATVQIQTAPDNNSTDAENTNNNTPIGEDTPSENTSAMDQTPNDVDTGNLQTAAPVATGADLSGGEDDSVTPTETLSLQGPFVRDDSRSAGPPSTPTGLTLLLSAENWLEFTWAPAADDQSVEAYEIYRDGVLIFTVRGDTNFEFDYRSWIGTYYIDCNYTRYPGCRDTQPTAGSSHEYTVVAVDNQGMSSPPSEPSVFELQLPQTTPVDLAGFSLVFNEEFNANSLDRSLWKTALPWGADTTINAEQQYFVNILGSDPLAYDPFVFTGDSLQITGIATPAALLNGANNLPYLSGVITTSDHFEMTYGYVEMRARLTGGEGLLSTFYLFNQDFEKNKPEIDIIEYIGSRPDKAYQTYHYFDSNRARYATGERHSSPTMETTANIDLSADFHNFSVLWQPGLIIWYIDDREVRRISGMRVSDEPMNIIAQLVVGSEWIGLPGAASIPARFEIDYIRAWQ